MDESLNLKINSQEGQRDLAALSKSLDKVAKSATNMDRSLSTAADNANASLTRASRSMGKYAEVTALLSKIRSPATQVKELGKALDAIGRAREIKTTQITNVIELGKALNTLKAPERLLGVSAVLNALGRVRVPSAAQSKNLIEFFGALASFKGARNTGELARVIEVTAALGRIRIPTGAQAKNLFEFFAALSSFKGARNTGDLFKMVELISTIRVPPKSQIDRLSQLFAVLSTAKSIPNATRIAEELNLIATSAERAGKALRSLPVRGRALAPSIGNISSGTSVTGGGGAVRTMLKDNEAQAARTGARFSLLGKGLGDLSSRFHLTYQAGTLLATMFASFTIGQFVRGIYDANIQLLKLQKAVLFSTGSFDGASEATDRFISMSQELGLSVKDNIETYGRFVIATKAANISLDQTNKIYHAVGQALTVVGASAQQQQLAFYGLTEMLQKGVVYSKEFNRQIGAQLPGNAILGARALSKLEGHVVSVSEFFEKMHTGTLLSPEFVPAWAAEVEKMYHPLLALAQARPDVAIARLHNAFFIFAKQVGQGKFMSAIGREITGLMNKFIVLDKDGISHLTPNAQKLADTLGNGLARAIHGAASAIGFIVDHFDQLIMAIKGFVAFELAGKFASISKAVLTAAAGMLKFSSAANVAAASEAAVATEASAVSAATIAATETGAAASAGNAVAAFRGVTFGRRVGASSFQRASRVAGPSAGRSFGRRLDLPLFNAADERELAAARARPGFTFSGPSASGTALREELGFKPQASLMSRIGGGAKAVGGAAFNGLVGAMSMMGPIAMGAAVALTMVSDKLTGVKTAAGNFVTYGDITSATLDSIGDSIGGWIKGLSGSGSALSKMTDSDVFGRFVAGLLAFGKAIVSFWPALASSIGRVIGTMIGSIINMAVRAAQSLNAVVHGDFSGAQRIYQQGVKEREGFGAQMRAGIQSDFSGVDVRKNFNDIMAGAQASADARSHKRSAETGDQKQLEAALRQQSAAAIIEAAAQKFENSSIGMEQLGKTLDPKQVLQDLKDFAGGKLDAGLSASQKQMLGPATNATLRDTLAAAGAQVGIDPNRLYALGMAESGFNAKNFGNKTSSAQGAFQITNAAYTDLSKDLGAFDRMDVGQSSVAAATYLKKADAVAEKIIGRALDIQESYIPYVLGGTGGAKLIKAAQENPNADAAKLFPAAAKANKNLFYAKDGTALTTQQTYAELVNRIARVGTDINPEDQVDANVGGNALTGGGSSKTDTSINKTADLAYKRIQAFIGRANPGAAAAATVQEQLTMLKQVRESLQGDLSKSNPFAKTFLSDPSIMEGVNRAMAELVKRQQEALDPISKMNRLSSQANDITEMRTKGLSDEADYQAEINKLVEQGYLRQEVDNQKNREAFIAEQNRTRMLQARIDLTKQLNDIEVHRMSRLSNNTLENAVTQGIASAALPGESLDQARARMSQSGQLGIIQQSAKANLQEQNDSAQQTMTESIGELQATYGLNPTAKSLRDDYKKALQDMTGLSTDSLARLNSAATDAQKQFAANFAQTKHALENPPGFQRWVDGLKPLSERLEEIKASFAESLSQGITDALSGDKVDVASIAKDFSKQILKAQVDNALAGTFKALGLATPATPEDTMSAATQTFDTSTQSFGQYVAQFGAAVSTGVAGQATAASGVASLQNTAASAVTSMASGSAGGGGASLDSILGSDLGGGANTAGTSPLMSALGFGGGNVAIQPYSDDALRAMNPISNSDLNMTMPSLNLPSQQPANFLDRLWSGSDGNGGISGFFGNLFGGSGSGGILGLAGGLIAPLMSLFGAGKSKPQPTYHMPQGIIGNMSNNVVSGTQIPGHANMIGSIINMVAQAAVGSMFSGGGSGTSPLMSSLGFGQGSPDISPISDSALQSMWSFSPSDLTMAVPSLREGGFPTNPVEKIATGGIDWANVPHYAEGTGNTSNGIPAMVHPNEAIIPLSRNRKIPVEMPDHAGGGGVNVSSPITIIAKDFDTFRANRNAISRQQNRTLKRAATRNLTTNTR